MMTTSRHEDEASPRASHEHMAVSVVTGTGTLLRVV
jgi:hypothetical protein